MKKCHIFLIALLCVFSICLMGCDNTQEEDFIPVTAGFSCRFTVDYRELALQGELKRFSSGKLVLTFSQPQSLDGVTIGWDGENMSMELAGMSVSVSPDKVPESALIKSLLGVLQAKPDNVMLTDEGYVMEGNVENFAYTLVCDGQTGLPISLSMPENELMAVFSEATAFTE